MDTPPTTVVELTNVSTEEEVCMLLCTCLLPGFSLICLGLCVLQVHSAEEASELEEDVKDECQQFGKAVKVVVPLPGVRACVTRCFCAMMAVTCLRFRSCLFCRRRSLDWCSFSLNPRELPCTLLLLSCLV